MCQDCYLCTTCSGQPPKNSPVFSRANFTDRSCNEPVVHFAAWWVVTTLGQAVTAVQVHHEVTRYDKSWWCSEDGTTTGDTAARTFRATTTTTRIVTAAGFASHLNEMTLLSNKTSYSYFLVSTMLARFMGPTRGPSGPTGPRWAPWWALNLAIWVNIFLGFQHANTSICNRESLIGSKSTMAQVNVPVPVRTYKALSHSSAIYVKSTRYVYCGMCMGAGPLATMDRLATAQNYQTA